MNGWFKVKITKKEDFIKLMKEISDGWKEVRKYDDDHLYYDRTRWINKVISDEWWDYPDDYDRDGDLETICILIEQYLRYKEIVKETRIGMLPKVDTIEDENNYILGSKRQNITEKNKKDMVDKFSNYLLKK